MEVYSRIKHVGVCVGYSATVKLVEEVSQLFMVPLQNWMSEDAIFNFWGDNLD